MIAASRESLSREVERLRSEISELKMNRLAASVSSENLQLLTDLSLDAFYYYDLQIHRFIFMNKMFRETFGQDPQGERSPDHQSYQPGHSPG